MSDNSNASSNVIICHDNVLFIYVYSILSNNYIFTVKGEKLFQRNETNFILTDLLKNFLYSYDVPLNSKGF